MRCRVTRRVNAATRYLVPWRRNAASIRLRIETAIASG
jgi:hypothetical protein